MATLTAPQSVVKPMRQNTAKERYLVITPITETASFHKIFTDYDTYTIEELPDDLKDYKSKNTPKFLNVDGIIEGIELAAAFMEIFHPGFVSMPVMVDSILIAEYLQGKQTFIGTISQFQEYKKKSS